MVRGPPGLPALPYDPGEQGEPLHAEVPAGGPAQAEVKSQSRTTAQLTAKLACSLHLYHYKPAAPCPRHCLHEAELVGYFKIGTGPKLRPCVQPYGQTILPSGPSICISLFHLHIYPKPPNPPSPSLPLHSTLTSAKCRQQGQPYWACRLR
jgi:hypothetical protein